MALDSSLKTLRLTGLLEGISWLLLLFFAMPLKYMAGQPLMVKYVGWLHGLLFIVYIILLINAWSNKRWKLKSLILGGIAALFPFGTWLFDKKLKHPETL